MPTKATKVKYDAYMNVVDLPNAKSKYKAPIYVEKPIITAYRQEVDEALLNDPKVSMETKQQIIDRREFGLIGVKSGKAAKILTTDEDKANRNSRFEEDNIVNRVMKDFKKEYPGIPFVIDRVSQSRSKFGGAVHKSSAYQKGNPDINIQCAKAGFNGCYVEQKKSDDIFYTGTKILKPWSENRHIWQSLYHADLREQGYWVMFSISEEATRKIISRYMSGNPYTQQIFEYYCKPEDYCIFQHHKHFKPVKRP